MEFSPETIKSNKLFEDVFDGKIPKRVPMLISNDSAFALEYAGFNLKNEQFSLDKIIEAIDKTTADFDIDTAGASFSRPLHLYRMLGAINFRQGDDGYLQHPEVSSLEPEEYDEFIADPMKTICDKSLPKIYKNLEKGSFESQKTMAKSFFSFFASMGKVGGACAGIANKYGRSTYSIASAGITMTPFDLLAGQLRSFSGVHKDVRRMPQKLAAACESLLPLTIKAGYSPQANRHTRPFIPCHMAPYMREKDFKKLYWPTFKAMVDTLDAKGISCNIFVEQDWMRYLDYLYELPKQTLLYFEYGDPKTIKEKLGKKHVICGLYPVNYLKSATKEEAIDKGKELYDIMAPGGNYILGLDKAFLRLNDANVDVAKSFFTAMKEYGKYSTT